MSDPDDRADPATTVRAVASCDGPVPGTSGTAFETPLGMCRITWSGTGVTSVTIGVDPSQMWPANPCADVSPPPAIARVREAIVAHLHGESDDLRWVEIDLGDVSDFDRAVYELCRTIDPGAVRTYGDVANALGRDGGARAVGGALGRNPIPLVVPCHRVTASHGDLGGFSAGDGPRTKRRLLELEHAPGFDDPVLF